MITSFEFFIIFGLFFVILLAWKRPFNVLLSWIVSRLLKKIFPHEHFKITVEDFGYFCAHGVSVHINKNRIVRIEQVVLQFLWEEFRLQLQSTATDIKLVTRAGKSTKQNQNCDGVVIKGSITVGVNLYSFDPPTELLCIAPETEHVHGSDIKVSELTSVWLFARNAQATIQGKLDGENVVSYDLLVSEGSALLLYNSNVARLIFLVNNARATCLNTNANDSGLNAQVASSEGLILVYKFEDGVLTSSHSRLKHTEINLTSSIISDVEDLVTKYVDANLEGSHYKENSKNLNDNQAPCTNDEISGEVKEEKCEVAMEAESITVNIFSSDRLKHFELKLAFISLGCPDKNTVRWSVSIPFEIIFINDLAGGIKGSVLGSKIKSEGLVNPCVLKLEGEEIPNKRTSWVVSTHEGILFEIKPEYVNTLETFMKCKSAKSQRFTVRKRNSALEDLKEGSNIFKDDVSPSNEPRVPLEHDLEKVKCKPQRMFEISAIICDITIDVKDTYDQKLLQVVMVHPKFSLSQDHEERSLSFKIETLKGFNCLENMPFFHPTEETGNGREKAASLELFIKERLTSHGDKLSFENFSFGSCDTTVVAEETLIFAILKHFGLHKKVAQIFFENREEENADKASSPSKRFYFENIELRAVEVVLTLLPAIDLPVELQVIKNNLGIPHQLPPRFENACLYFDAFVRNNIQYGSYKYISYDIKKHYLKELGSQSARVLGSMHLLGNISRLKQDIMSGFTTLRETGEFITFFRQVTTGVASSYSKFTGSWSDLFGLNSPNRSSQEPQPYSERRHSDPSDLDVAVFRQLSNECAEHFQVNSTPQRKSKDDSAVLDVEETSECIWLHSSILPVVTDETDGLNWDTESSDGEGNLGIPLDLIPRNVKRQLKGQEFLRRLKENIGDNEHGEVFACCFKVRKDVVETKLNALLSNRKVYFLKGRPSHESLVLCVKYESLYKAQYIFQDKTHYLQLMSKMKGIRTLSVPSRNPSESPLVRCDNMVIARKVSTKINELKRTYDQEYMHSQHQ